MLLVPDMAGRPKAGSPLARPAGTPMLYAKVPACALAKLNVKVPTGVSWVFDPVWLKGWPLVTKAVPVIEVGVVQVPPGITSQSGLKPPGDAASGWRGS